MLPAKSASDLSRTPGSSELINLIRNRRKGVSAEPLPHEIVYLSVMERQRLMKFYIDNVTWFLLTENVISCCFTEN